MLDHRKLDALKSLLDPEVVAAWLDELNSHRARGRKPDIVQHGSSPIHGEGLLDVKEVCERLRVQPSWVYEKTRQGVMPHVRVGTYIRFRWHEVDAWLDETSPSQIES